jgi:SAM-dependent methyltransferase
MAWWYAVVEARHELQNPTSPEKIRLLGERLGLTRDSRVLDVASGRGGPALLLAREFGCRLTCIERAPEFTAVARERVEAAGLDDLIETVEADASSYSFEHGRYDAALCLGASFVFGGLVETLAALRPTVVRRGFVAIGEPYWRKRPLPPDFELEEGEEEFGTLEQTVERLQSAGVEVVSLIDSSLDDWDRYRTLMWLALEEWLAANPEHPQADEFRSRGRHYRDRYLLWTRDLMGWAIFVCRRT